MAACYFFKMGTCRFGSLCRFKHENESGVSVLTNEEQSSSSSSSSSSFVDRSLESQHDSSIAGSGSSSIFVAPCKFISTGKTCPYGESCFYSHNTAQETTDNINSTVETCGICFDNITKYGLLNSCDHAFCNGCIISWRKEAEKTTSAQDKTSKRTCPLCREHSDFVIASYTFVTGEAKKEYITGVLAERSLIPCKQYMTDNTCKFGGYCFYAHLDEEGKCVKAKQLQEKKDKDGKRNIPRGRRYGSVGGGIHRVSHTEIELMIHMLGLNWEDENYYEHNYDDYDDDDDEEEEDDD